MEPKRAKLITLVFICPIANKEITVTPTPKNSFHKNIISISGHCGDMGFGEDHQIIVDCPECKEEHSLE